MHQFVDFSIKLCLGPLAIVAWQWSVIVTLTVIDNIGISIGTENHSLKIIEQRLVVGTFLHFLDTLNLSDDSVHCLLRNVCLGNGIFHQGIHHHLPIACALGFL